MTARRSTSDPVSEFLKTGERVVWRHQPDPRTLLYNRLPATIVVLVFVVFGSWVAAHFFAGAAGGNAAQRRDDWAAMPWAFVLFSVILVAAFIRFAWVHVGSVLDSWSTHYALTNRRFMIVSRRGVIEYDATYFRKMEALGGAPGAQVLAFNWGRLPKGRENYRNRIAALPDSKKLEQLIRETLRA